MIRQDEMRAVADHRFFPILIPTLRSPSISPTSATGSITTPLPMTQIFRGRKMPTESDAECISSADE